MPLGRGPLVNTGAVFLATLLRLKLALRAPALATTPNVPALPFAVRGAAVATPLAAVLTVMDCKPPTKLAEAPFTDTANVTDVPATG
jgi:hypothetical protein